MSALWTAEEDAKLKQMLADGCSFTRIGAALGRSRQSVSGYVWRNRAKFGPSNKKSPSLPISSPAVKPEAVSPPPAVSGEIQPIGIPLLKLGWRDCRYVIAGDGANALFCGDETVSPSCSWCAHHRDLVFAPRVAVEKAREAVAA